MTTLSDKPFELRSTGPGRSRARDDPANIDLGATQSIDISALIAAQDHPAPTSEPLAGTTGAPASVAVPDHES